MGKLLDKAINSTLQSKMAVACFVAGVAIACVCLFAIPPLGEIASTAITIVSELLVLCGALLGVNANFDLKMKKMEANLINKINKEKNTEDNGK